MRTQPVTVTGPLGGSGASTSVLPLPAVAIQPRSTSTAAPDSVTSGVRTSTPGAPSRVRYVTTS